MVSKKVLVACEFSGIVRDAFRDKGFDAYSCDLRETESYSEYHFQEDVFKSIEREDWDLMVAHPPCTYLSNSGVRWLYEKDDRWQDMIQGAVFFRKLLNADIPHVAVENPIMHKWGKKIIGAEPNQTVQPYQFGHPMSKATCLWLRDLPELEATDILEKEGEVWDNQTKSGQNFRPPSDDRGKERSRFWVGIADAMADQWGDYIQ